VLKQIRVEKLEEIGLQLEFRKKGPVYQDSAVFDCLLREG